MMNLRKKVIVSTIVIALGAQVSALTAKDTVDQQLIDQARPMVTTYLDTVLIEAPFVSNMIVMNVRVYNEQNEEVLYVRSQGEPAELMAAGLPDGEYRYQAVTIFQLDNPIGEGGRYEDEGSSRQSGSFRVINGEISQDTQKSGVNEQSSLMDSIIDHAVNLAGAALDVLVSSAHAQDLFATGDIPFVFWNDTTYVGCCDFGVGVTLPTATNGAWSVLDLLGNNGQQVITVHGIAGTTLNTNAFVVDVDGDLHWGNGLLNLDKGAESLSLGWSNTDASISLSSPTPDIVLHDSSDNGESVWELSNGITRFYGRKSGGFWNAVMKYRVDAPTNSLTIDSNGLVGLGTDSPNNAALEVHRSDGKAKIVVTEEGPEKQRDLFHMKNNGITHFKIENTEAQTQWVFSNAGSWFNISLQGSGGAEFKVYDNGDAVLRGILVENSDVNSKQNIEAVDGSNVLEKLRKLEISEWSYKDAPKYRHVGPMAQDFYATFGLGNTDKGIATLDTSGIALAAIKALIEENISLTEQNASLERRLSLLEGQQAEVQATVAKLLENQQGQRVLTSTVLN